MIFGNLFSIFYTILSFIEIRILKGINWSYLAFLLLFLILIQFLISVSDVDAVPDALPAKDPVPESRPTPCLSPDL